MSILHQKFFRVRAVEKVNIDDDLCVLECIMEPEVPLKKKDQVALDEEMARNLEAQLQAELIEEERIARQKEEEANIALL
ncbi:hypothetical protein Tco_1069904 [Tanacetum coccineum]|uniref:Uncharacterized protein n=1 Tax=Tanacetum coccineum TaxID=301880 RepID=A0ABQ5HJV5_9ASTR